MYHCAPHHILSQMYIAHHLCTARPFCFGLSFCFAFGISTRPCLPRRCISYIYPHRRLLFFARITFSCVSSACSVFSLSYSHLLHHRMLSFLHTHTYTHTRHLTHPHAHTPYLYIDTGTILIGGLDSGLDWTGFWIGLDRRRVGWI
jgi:hypothetical protein